MISFVTDRLGHDRRYAIDSGLAARELKGKALRNFKEGTESTVGWYLKNHSWWQRCWSGPGRY